MWRHIAKSPALLLSLIAAIALLLTGVTLANADGPASLGRTPWQMFRTPTYVSVSPVPSPLQHGNIQYYNYAPAIPAPNDVNWQPAPNGNTINMHYGSRLPGCWSWADFTFFQSFVSIPANATVTEFKVVMNGADDGARVSIINSLYPAGLVVSGSYIFLGGAQSTSDLSPYVALGEVNRVVITQVDDCAVANNLNYAAITLNGTVVQVNRAPVVAANNNSVTVNEGQSATNAGTFSDPDGDAVTLSASVGAVTVTGPGTWSWSFPATDGPDQSQQVTVTATDGKGGIATAQFQLTVNNVAPTITAAFQVAPIPEGSVLTNGNLVAQATDPAGSNDPLTFSFDCDNNGVFETPAYPNTSSADCSFDDNGSYPVGVRVSDGDGGVATGSIMAIVLNVPPTAFLPNAGPVNEGSPATLHFEAQFDPSHADNIAGFHYSFACDGLDASLATSYAGSGASNSTTCTFGDNGSYTVKGRIFDKDNGSNTYAATVTVNNVAPVLDAGPDQTLPFGSLVSISATFADPGTLDTWTYAINWGDGSPLQTGSATPSSPITGSHQYVIPGNQTVTICVEDDDLGKDCKTVAITFISTPGKITAGTLRFGNNGRGGFNVQSGDGVAVKGELEYQNGSENLHASTMTAIAVSPDLTKGWFAGVLKDGRVFVAYVEDNGEPGKNDVFKLWINGVLQNGDGKLTGGNVQLHKS